MDGRTGVGRSKRKGRISSCGGLVGGNAKLEPQIWGKGICALLQLVSINGVLSVKCFEECYGSHIASRLGWIAKWWGLAGSTEVFVKAMCPVSLQSCVHVLLSIQPKLTTIPPSLSKLHKPWFACILLSANPYLQILVLSIFCTFGLKLCLRFTFFSWIQLVRLFSFCEYTRLLVTGLLST